MRAIEFISEKINSDILDPRFTHTQQIGKFTYKAFAYTGRPGLNLLRIQAFDGPTNPDYRIGDVMFRVNKDDQGGHLESLNTWVADFHRKDSIASTMYAYAKMLGNDILPSKDQLPDGKAMWAAWNKSGEAEHLMREEMIDEMPLPVDWDQSQYGPGSTFKKRLAYALERAKKIGTGSSRVATIIEYQGRPTVLKIAKNQKGLAQNSVEADILSDGYASQLGILIPIIDYDDQNEEPTWVHTEMATKASEKQLCSIMKCDNLNILVNMAWAITGKKKYMGNYQDFVEYLKKKGQMTDEDIETLAEYANTLADLNSNFDVELGDFARAANWGMYQGKPVIIDEGFNSNVFNQY